MRFVIACGIAVYSVFTGVCHAQPGRNPFRGSQAAVESAPSAARSGQPIVTRQDSFTIPFQVHQSAIDGGAPAEVSLFVSADRGGHWTSYQRQRPDGGRFTFRAARDGEYWFTIRTVDQAGEMYPRGRPEPEMRVVVDTVLPRLDLTVDSGPSGEIHAQWNATDENLSRDSFRLQYRASADELWQTVAVDLAHSPLLRDPLSGSASWWPHAAQDEVEIRAEVADAAGNLAVVNRSLRLHPFSPNRYTQADQRPEAPPTDVSPAPGPEEAAVQSPITSQPAAVDQNSPTTANKDIVESPQEQPWDAYIPKGPAPTVDPDFRELTTLNNGSAEQPSAPPGDSTADAEQAAQNFPVDQLVAGPVHPPVAQRYATDSGSLPPGTQPRTTNSRKFRLDYEVQHVPVAEVEKVELWETSNGGQTSRSVAEDDDKQSPIDVEVQQEGVYGYRLVVHASSGLSGAMPNPGDLADVWVAADWTLPTARITSAQYGRGAELGSLQIHWEADDARLSPRPISLKFSAQKDGPWSTIASGLPNTGRYDWQVDPRLPEQFYLRLEVRDAADNLGVDQLAEPISSDGLAPQGHIRRILPVTE